MVRISAALSLFVLLSCAVFGTPRAARAQSLNLRVNPELSSMQLGPAGAKPLPAAARDPAIQRALRQQRQLIAVGVGATLAGAVALAFSNRPACKDGRRREIWPGATVAAVGLSLSLGGLIPLLRTPLEVRGSHAPTRRQGFGLPFLAIGSVGMAVGVLTAANSPAWSSCLDS